MSEQEMAAKVAAMSPEEKAAILAKAAKGNRTGEAEIRAKYPWAKEGTLQYDPVARKQSMVVVCQHEGCGAEERRFTSDLFQIRFCSEHKSAAKKAARAEKQEQMRKMAALIARQEQPTE